MTTAAPFGGRFGAVLPALIIALAVLWDWALRLSWEGWNGNEDVSIFIFTGQRLADGILNWTQVFYETKPLVVQFLFYPVALLGAWFNPYKVWHLMSMGACLIGAYSVYVILRDVFSPQRGFGSKAGHYAGLYGGVFTLYLFSAAVYEPHHVNPLAVSMALAAAALLKGYVASLVAAGMKTGPAAVSALLLSCFCASIAVGVRPYLMVFVALIPAWIAIAAQLAGATLSGVGKILASLPRKRESRQKSLDSRLRGNDGGGASDGNIDYRAVVKLFILWNGLVALMVLAVNALPYIITGEWDSFIAGLQMMRQTIAPGGIDWALNTMRNVYNGMGWFSRLLFYAWLICIALLLIRLLTGLAGRFPGKAAGFELFALTLVAPASILGMILTKNFWGHYSQFFLPFISIGAVSLVVLLHNRQRRGFPLPAKAVAAVITLILVSPLEKPGGASPITELRTRSTPEMMAATTQNLSDLLSAHNLQSGDFLTPYNQYAHVRLNQHRYGFPNVSATVDTTLRGWFQNAQIPARYRIPTNSEEYCQMLDEQGPGLIVFFAWTTFWGPQVPPTHLANCNLSQYEFHNLSAEARQASDIAFYFVRR